MLNKCRCKYDRGNKLPINIAILCFLKDEGGLYRHHEAVIWNDLLEPANATCTSRQCNCVHALKRGLIFRSALSNGLSEKILDSALTHDEIPHRSIRRCVSVQIVRWREYTLQRFVA